MTTKTTPRCVRQAAFNLALFTIPAMILIGVSNGFHLGEWLAALGVTSVFNLGLFVWAAGGDLPVLGDREVG